MGWVRELMWNRCVGKGGQSIYGKPFADEVRGTIKVS
jgi:hypothetical protein